MSAPKRSSRTQKKYGQLSKVFYSYAYLAVLGGILHLIGLSIQSNFYSKSNGFFELYQAAGIFQLSITSGTAVFLFTGIGLAAYCVIQRDLNLEYSRRSWWRMVGLVLLGGVVYSGYEFYQFLFPEYYDRPLLDVLVAWIATLVLLVPLLLLPPKSQD